MIRKAIASVVLALSLLGVTAIAGNEAPAEAHACNPPTWSHSTQLYTCGGTTHMSTLYAHYWLLPCYAQDIYNVYHWNVGNITYQGRGGLVHGC